MNNDECAEIRRNLRNPLKSAETCRIMPKSPKSSETCRIMMNFMNISNSSKVTESPEKSPKVQKSQRKSAESLRNFSKLLEFVKIRRILLNSLKSAEIRWNLPNNAEISEIHWDLPNNDEFHGYFEFLRNLRKRRIPDRCPPPVFFDVNTPFSNPHFPVPCTYASHWSQVLKQMCRWGRNGSSSLL